MEVEGITFQPLVAGMAAELPQEATALVLLRVTLEAGASAPPEEPHPGPELIFLESGSVAVTVTTGEAYVLRAADMATPGAEMEAGELATVGEEITLEAGDAFFAHTGSLDDFRTLGEEPAVALVGVVAPAGHEEAEHATPVP
jgi:quercetin dioxygenase-like cupin family protein